MITANVTIDSRNLKKRLNRVQNRLANSSERNVRDIGIYVRDMMKVMTPRDTGMTADSIMVKDITKSKTGASLSVGQRFIPVKSGSPGFNLLKFMLESKKALNGWHAYGNPMNRLVNFKSGDIKGLREVIPEARKAFRIQIRNDVNKIVKE